MMIDIGIPSIHLRSAHHCIKFSNGVRNVDVWMGYPYQSSCTIRVTVATMIQQITITNIKIRMDRVVVRIENRYRIIHHQYNHSLGYEYDK